MLHTLCIPPADSRNGGKAAGRETRPTPNGRKIAMLVVAWGLVAAGAAGSAIAGPTPDWPDHIYLQTPTGPVVLDWHPGTFALNYGIGSYRQHGVTTGYGGEWMPEDGGVFSLRLDDWSNLELFQNWTRYPDDAGEAFAMSGETPTVAFTREGYTHIPEPSTLAFFFDAMWVGILAEMAAPVAWFLVAVVLWGLVKAAFRVGEGLTKLGDKL